TPSASAAPRRPPTDTSGRGPRPQGEARASGMTRGPAPAGAGPLVTRGRLCLELGALAAERPGHVVGASPVHRGGVVARTAQRAAHGVPRDERRQPTGGAGQLHRAADVVAGQLDVTGGLADPHGPTDL